MRASIPLLAAIFALASPSVVRGQSTARGSIEGEITDSLHARPLAGGLVFITRLSPEPSEYHSIPTDEKGRYRLERLSAGRYSVAFTHDFLDSLGTALPPRELSLADGEHARVDFALPSAARLRAAACPGMQLPANTGALLGRITDADTDRPLANAVVALAWSDLSLDTATKSVNMQARSASLRTDSTGVYRFCGVPIDSWLLVQVQMNGRGGSAVRVVVPADITLASLDLSFSASGSWPLVPVDSATGVPERQQLLSGTASLTGTVAGAAGQPLADVQVRIVDAAPVAHTDSIGRFTLHALPSGTQLLEARRLGYLITRQPVELRAGRGTDTELRLQRIVSLDSIRVLAQRGTRYREFERNKRNPFGRYLDEAQIERQHALEVSDIVRMTPGVRIVGYGYDARVVSSRGATFRGPCELNVVIDGMQNMQINQWVQPGDIAAMEIYTGAAGAPPQYDRGCGAIVIWTKR